MAPVGQASRQPACSQCLQTSERKFQPNGFAVSRNLTCLHVALPRLPELSYERPVQTRPSSGTSFHSLQATSHALQPMQTVGSVKKPTVALRGVMTRGPCAPATVPVLSDLAAGV